jgi:hypothetical protein
MERTVYDLHAVPSRVCQRDSTHRLTGICSSILHFSRMSEFIPHAPHAPIGLIVSASSRHSPPQDQLCSGCEPLRLQVSSRYAERGMRLAASHGPEIRDPCSVLKSNSTSFSCVNAELTLTESVTRRFNHMTRRVISNLQPAWEDLRGVGASYFAKSRRCRGYRSLVSCL